MDKRDRILGSLLGFAIGDAMGATTEFMTAEKIAEKYGRVSSILGGGWLYLKPGEVTDDTQMMLCVYKAMKETENHPDRTLSAMCKAFRDWADTNPPDIGWACRQAIYGTKSCKALDWIAANRARQATTQMDLGNGGLMRCLIPCLSGNLDLAVHQAYLTHSNSIQREYIVLYFDLIKEAIKGERYDFDCSHCDPTGHIRNTYHNAEYWYRYSKTFEEAIISAVNDGGDADTIAALTGGLAGAYYGVDAIPKDWIDTLDKDVVNALLDVTNWLT